jgi:hypothetical protein
MGDDWAQEFLNAINALYNHPVSNYPITYFITVGNIKPFHCWYVLTGQDSQTTSQRMA